MTGALMTVCRPRVKICPFLVNRFAIIGTKFDALEITFEQFSSETFFIDFSWRNGERHCIFWLESIQKVFLSLNKHIVKQKENNTSRIVN